MAADQERAERIRALKQERPDLTWRRIADHVGVTERSATDWQRKGGIEYDNAKKLAELFEVDVDYIWRGTETDTPSPFAGQDAAAALEGALGDVLREIQAQLAEQTRVLDEIKAYAEQVAEMLNAQRTLKEETDGLAESIRRATREMRQPQASEPDRPPAPEPRAAAPKKRAAKPRTPSRP